MHRFIPRCSLFAAIVAAMFALVGCGGSNAPVVSIGFSSNDLKPDGLVIGKGGATLIEVNAYDNAGNIVDVSASSFQWSSSDGSILGVKLLGGYAAEISGKIDWFDTVAAADAGTDGSTSTGDDASDDSGGGADSASDNAGDDASAAGAPYEPMAWLTVTYTGPGPTRTAAIPVSVVINVAGTWHVSIPGIIEQNLPLSQQGRMISATGTTTGTDASASGFVNGNQFTLNQQGYVLTGAFTSPTDANGVATAPGGLSGTWTAHKIK